MNLKKLFKQAQKLKEKAHCPYSNFHVAALVILKDGSIIEGVNVENYAYGSTICAERNALHTSVTQGYKKDDIDYIVLTSDFDKPTSPCGDCRQVMHELCNEDVVLHMFNSDGSQYKSMTIKELIPQPWD